MNGLFKKFIEFAIGNGLVLILGVISTPIVSRLIAPYEKGRADMFVLYTSLIVLVINMGLDQAYIRFFNSEEESERGNLLRRAIKIPTILSLCIGIIILIFYKEVSNRIVGETSILLSILFAFHSFFSIMSNFSLIHLRMKQKAKTYSVLGASNKITFIIFLLIFFNVYKGSYITVVLATVLGNLAMLIVAVLLERKDWFGVKKDKNLKTSTRELVKYGNPFIFSMGLTWVFQGIDKLSLEGFTDYSQVGIYTGAMSIIAILNTVQGAFTTFWIPVAYDKYNKNPEDKKFFSNINEIVSFCMLILAIGLIVSKDLLMIILGEKYQGSQFVFPFLVFMPIMYTISETTVLGINFQKKTKYHIYVAAMSAITNVAGNLYLVPKMGATGAAISTGLAYVVFFITRSYFGNKLYKIEVNYFKLFTCIISVYILAAISSVYSFNTLILVVALINIIIVIIMYRRVAKNILNMIIGFIKIRKNNSK